MEPIDIEIPNYGEKRNVIVPTTRRMLYKFYLQKIAFNFSTVSFLLLISSRFPVERKPYLFNITILCYLCTRTCAKNAEIKYFIYFSFM